jgi:hypothetical protein
MSNRCPHLLVFFTRPSVLHCSNTVQRIMNQCHWLRGWLGYGTVQVGVTTWNYLQILTVSEPSQSQSYMPIRVSYSKFEILNNNTYNISSSTNITNKQ